MPLPTSNLTWPPTDLDAITPQLNTWSAWYSGNPDDLRSAYQNSGVRTRVDRAAQYRGGVTGAVARFWWGRPVGDLTRHRDDQLHVPLATDLCQASADLLFSEPPNLTVEDPTAQSRLDALAGDGLHGVLAETAEAAAALGGAFLRVTWDRTVVEDGPFLTRVDADAAWPEFRWGRLVAVTFWTVVRADGDRRWRHLERHELDARGYGIVLHGLYEGTADRLGQPRPLAENPATAALSDVVDMDGAIDTESPGLAVEYVPNQRPQRRWRTHPVGRHLGRSDLDGVEPLMDALDETWSSWMRDLRLAKARIIVPEYMLDDLGPGQGAAFDLDREVYSTLKAAPTSNVGITPQQFAIRVTEHQDTASSLVKQILRTAGYSAQTFGEAEGGGMKTATEVVSEQNRSFMTRDRKIRLWRPALERVTEKLLAVDAAKFGANGALGPVKAEFGDGVQADPEALARTSQLLRQAQAASTETLVKLNQPDLDGDELVEEVGRILAEQGMAVPDPTVLP